MSVNIALLNSEDLNNFYDWEIPQELGFIEDILKSWFDNCLEPEDIIKKIKSEARKRDIKIPKEKIVTLYNLENEIEDSWPHRRLKSLISEDSEDEDLLDNDEILKRIKYLLFLKYIDIFYSLSTKSKVELTPFFMKAIIANILNWKLNSPNKDVYTFITDKNLISIFQSMHWDLSIHKYPIYQENKIINSNQLDLFYPSKYENGKIINIDLDSVNIEGKIWIYQRTSNFFKTLLLYCYKYNFFPKELNTLLNIEWEIPFASDSFDTKTNWENFFYDLVDNNEIGKLENIDFSISHSPNTDLNANITQEWIYVKQEDDKIVLKIKKEEIWYLLQALMYLPWRSYNENILILKEFFKRKKIRDLHS